MALNGALTGTSATFRVSSDRNLATRFDTNIVLSAQSDTAAPESLRIYADTFRLFTATTAVGLAERFTISNTGTATFSGSVGINGVTSPSAELQVGKSSDVTIAMSNSSSVTSGNRGSLAWYNSNVSSVATIRAAAVTDNVGTELQFFTRPAAGSLTQVLTLSSTGNLSLGVTPSAWGTDFKAFQIGTAGGTSIVSDDWNGFTEVLNNVYASARNTYTRIQSLGAARYSQQLGTHVWYSVGAGSGGTTVSFTPVMTLTDGNLLIGTTTNAGSNQPLQVIKAGSSNYLRLQVDNNASYDCGHFFTDGTNSVYSGMLRGTSGLTGAYSIFTGGAIRLSVTSGGAVIAGQRLGKSYVQTSSSGGTSIINTGITYDTGDYGGYGRGVTYRVDFQGNPNAAGSGAYLAQHSGILMVYTGWNGSAVTTYIEYTSLANGSNIGNLTLTPVFWNGTTETSTIGVYTGGVQIRLKISGYNSSFPGADQTLYLTRIT
jgi:hypothetical protein